MPTDDGKMNVTVRAATLIISFVCLIVLSALAAYLVARFEYKRQLTARDPRVGTMREGEKALTGRNVELLSSPRKLKNGTGGPGPAETSAVKTGAKQEHPVLGKQKESAGAVLEPTWVSAGKAILLFDGNLRIVLRQALAGDMCRKGSTVACHISSGAGGENLCLRTGAPARFAYRGRSYMINLSGIAGRDSVYHYYISINPPKQVQ